MMKGDWNKKVESIMSLCSTFKQIGYLGRCDIVNEHFNHNIVVYSTETSLNTLEYKRTVCSLRIE